jgi:hypothetical protein
MGNGDHPLVVPVSSTTVFAELEAQLVKAVADFGLDELSQLLDAAEAIRRMRRI